MRAGLGDTLNAALTGGCFVLIVGLLSGCRLPGRPAQNSTPKRPDQVLDFQTLYHQNCAACHGEHGAGGAAVALASPVYLAYAGAGPVADITSKGIPGSLMPAFSKSYGGLLTEQQVHILAEGLMQSSKPSSIAAVGTPPPYQSQATGDPVRGEALYRQSCLRCHQPGQGSILDPTYLSLISDGGLRTLIVVGRPEGGMPDWRGYPGGALSDQSIADIVSFLASHRRPSPAASTPENASATPAAPVPNTHAERKGTTP